MLSWGSHARDFADSGFAFAAQGVSDSDLRDLMVEAQEEHARQLQRAEQQDAKKQQQQQREAKYSPSSAGSTASSTATAATAAASAAKPASSAAPAAATEAAFHPDKPFDFTDVSDIAAADKAAKQQQQQQHGAAGVSSSQPAPAQPLMSPTHQAFLRRLLQLPLEMRLQYEVERRSNSEEEAKVRLYCFTVALVWERVHFLLEARQLFSDTGFT